MIDISYNSLFTAIVVLILSAIVISRVIKRRNGKEPIQSNSVIVHESDKVEFSDKIKLMRKHFWLSFAMMPVFIFLVFYKRDFVFEQINVLAFFMIAWSLYFYWIAFSAKCPVCKKLFLGFPAGTFVVRLWTQKKCRCCGFNLEEEI